MVCTVRCSIVDCRRPSFLPVAQLALGRGLENGAGSRNGNRWKVEVVAGRSKGASGRVDKASLSVGDVDCEIGCAPR